MRYEHSRMWLLSQVGTTASKWACVSDCTLLFALRQLHFFFLSELLSFADENIIMCSVCHCNFVKTLHLGASRFLYKLKFASVGCCYCIGLLFKYQLLLLYWSFLLLYCSFYGICYGNVLMHFLLIFTAEHDRLLQLSLGVKLWVCGLWRSSVCHLGKKEVLDMCSAVNSF